MKKLLLLPLLLALSLNACRSKHEDPTPTPTQSPVPRLFPRGPGVALWLGVRDAATGERFTPRMAAQLYLYPPEWTEAEVRSQAVFDEQRGWLTTQTLNWGRADVEPGGYAWHADKTILLSVDSKANAVFVWQFPDGNLAKPRYSQYYQFLGVLTKETHLDITIDRAAAGL